MGIKHHIAFDLEFVRNNFSGKLIAIEGIDGSGKTTQAHDVTKALTKAGIKAIYTKEPTDQPTGKFIRKILSGSVKVPAISLQYIYNADRAIHLEIIKKHLEQGTMVVTDRYFWSSVAYAISDLDGTADYYLTAFSILSFYNQFMIPDFSFFLKVSTDVALQRIRQSGKHTEIYDKAEKLPKIIEGYNFLLAKFTDEFTIIDGDQSEKKVTEEIVGILKKELKK